MFFLRKWLLMLPVSLLFSPFSNASNLLVMGDSLSAAYNLRQEAGWVSLLENQLSTSHPDIKIINASVSGETSQGGLSRFTLLMSAHQPRWVILELGANDALRGYPLAQTADNLERMIEQSQQANAKILLIGNRIPQNFGKRYTDMFFNLYQTIANKHQLAYMPFMLEGIALDKNLMQDDGLHPNKAGQLVIMKNILPYLSPLLEHEREGKPSNIVTINDKKPQ